MSFSMLVSNIRSKHMYHSLSSLVTLKLVAFFAVMLLRQRVGESVGEEMWLAARDGDPLPEVLDHADDDSVLRRQMKQLVLDMTQYSVRDRFAASEVLRQVKKLADAHARKLSQDITRLAGDDGTCST